jgi:hypothetical protein
MGDGQEWTAADAAQLGRWSSGERRLSPAGM